MQCLPLGHARPCLDLQSQLNRAPYMTLCAILRLFLTEPANFLFPSLTHCIFCSSPLYFLAMTNPTRLLRAYKTRKIQQYANYL